MFLNYISSEKNVTTERRDKIVELVKKKGSVKVEELATRFDVSTVTIRNDLNYLRDKGYLVRSHGSAVINENFDFGDSKKSKFFNNSRVKESIAKEACEQLGDSDIIIIASGSTSSRVVKHLHEDISITVITNSIAVSQELSHMRNINLIILGGEYQSNTDSIVGRDAETQLRNYYVDKLFIGVDGFDMEFGLTTLNNRSAEICRVMCDVAQEIIVLADSSKFGKRSFSKIIDVNKISQVITDSGINENIKRQLLENNINLKVIA